MYHHSMEPRLERWYLPIGRIGRATWLVRFGIVLAMVFGPILVTQIAFGGRAPEDVRGTVGCAMLPVILGCVAFRIIQDVKRLHDMGRSGLWALCAVVPGVNLLYMLVLVLAEGQPFANEYGPAPGAVAPTPE